jgi:hypothetical protein
MIERRMQVGKVIGILLGRKPPAGNALLEMTSRHSASPFLVVLRKASTFCFFINWSIFDASR